MILHITAAPMASPWWLPFEAVLENRRLWRNIILLKFNRANIAQWHRRVVRRDRPRQLSLIQPRRAANVRGSEVNDCATKQR